MATFFAYIPAGRRATVNDPKPHLNQTAKDISTALSVPPGILLWIQTRTSRQPLAADSKPFRDFPELVLSSRPQPWIRPEAFLFPRTEVHASFISIAVFPESQSPVRLPRFFSDFDVTEFRSKTAADVITKVVSDFGLDTESVQLFLGADEIAPSRGARDLILAAKTQGFRLRAVLSEKGLGRVTTRGLVIKEIFTTEETFVNDLRTIQDVWEPLMRSRKLISDDHAAGLFKDIRTILGGQNFFLDALRAVEQAYGGEIAPVFLDGAQIFTLMQGYVSNYSRITDILKVYQGQKKFEEAVRRQASECRGRDLASYMITPVQRMPRYMLFIRELLKFTPPLHPDFELLEVARGQIEQATRRFDDTAARVTSQGSLVTLQQSISNGFTFLGSARTLVFQAAITYDSKKVETGTIYLFQNMVLIVKAQSEGRVKTMFDSEGGIFPYKCQYPKLNSYTVDFSDKPYHSQFRLGTPECTFTFDDPAKETEFLSELARQQERFAVESPAKYSVRWTNIRVSAPLPALVRPEAVAIGADVFIFTGESSQLLKLRNGALTPAANLPPSLPEVIAASTGDVIILFTGLLFMQLNPGTGEVTTLDVGLDIAMRRGATLSSYGRDVILFGGKGAKGRRQYFNEVIVLQVRTRKAVVHRLDPAPAPRWRHSATVIGSLLYVYGGSDGSPSHIPLSDVWVLDLLRLQWRQVPVDLPPRRRHSALALNGAIGVFAGTGPRGSGTVVFNPKTAEVYTTADFGNLPDGRCASVVIAGDHVVVVTGAAKKGRAAAGLYTPTLPHAIRPVGPAWDDRAAVSDAPVLRRRRTRGIDPGARKSQVVRGQIVFEDDQYDDEDVSPAPASNELESMNVAPPAYLSSLIPPSNVNLRPASHMIVSIIFVVALIAVMLFVASRIK